LQLVVFGRDAGFREGDPVTGHREEREEGTVPQSLEVPGMQGALDWPVAQTTDIRWLDCYR
jgi:hypothetical protein